MRLGIRIFLYLALAATFSACGNSHDKCGNKFLVLWPDASGAYTFQEKTLSTLNDPYSLSGGAAKVYFQSALDGGGYHGSVAAPHFTRSGDTCVPMDVGSSMAVSVYAQFEGLLQFEQALGVSNMLSWPRRVGLDIDMVAQGNANHNNAHYFGGSDSIAILPYDMKGVPLALNLGVVAHEHFHGHFQRQVNNILNGRVLRTPITVENLFYGAFFATQKPTVEDMGRQDLTSPSGLNAFILRGWNEGLADFYGGIYKGTPKLFDESLPALAAARGLDSPPQILMTADGWQNYAKGANPDQMVALAYDQGAYLARTMYRLANAGVEDPHIFLTRVLRHLQDVADAVLPDYDARVLQFDRVFEILLRDFPRTKAVCDVLQPVISKESRVRSFGACGTSSI